MEAGSPEWHEARADRITGSRVAALMGLSPWTTREQLLEEMLSPTFKSSRKMEWGKRDEGNTLRRFTDASGFSTMYQEWYKETEFTACTGDGWVYTPQAIEPDWEPELVSAAPSYWKAFLEDLKAVKEESIPIDVKLREHNKKTGYNGDPLPSYWGKTCPDHYWCQIQWQCHHTHRKHGVLVGRIGAIDMRGYVVTYDETWAKEAVAEAEKFINQLKEAREL